MLVQYHEHFGVVAEFDPESGTIQLLPRPAGMPPSGTDGWFAVLGGSCVVFYRESAHLWLRIGDRVFDLDRDAYVDWRIENRTAVFAAADNSGQIVLRYPAADRSEARTSEDPTPFVAPEDWDLGLFIANVMFDEERSDLVRRGPA